MAELFLKVFARDGGERVVPFEIDFDDFPQFDPEDEGHISTLEEEVINFLERYYA